MNPDILLCSNSGSREIQMHIDTQIRPDLVTDAASARDPADAGRLSQTFEVATDGDLVWRPPLLIVIASILVWVWIIFEIHQVIDAPPAPDTAPGLFE